MIVFDVRRGKKVKRISGQLSILVAFALLFLLVTPAHAQVIASHIDLTQHPVGYLALLIFFAAYGFVVVEKAIQLRKSKPVMLAAGLIWGCLALSTPCMARVLRSRSPQSM